MAGKSKVTVVSQKLRHQGHGRYDGTLTVELENGDSALISPEYFLPVDWWNCDIADAVKYAPVIAEVLPDAKPLDIDGRWRKMKSSQKVLCTNDRPPNPRIDRDLIACDTSDQKLYFEKESLRIIY